MTAVDTEVDSTGAIIGYGYLTEGKHASISTLRTVPRPPEKPRSRGLVHQTRRRCVVGSPLDGSVGPEGEAVTFEATAEDVDVAENMPTAEWSSDKDGVLGTSAVNTDGSITFPYSGLSVDTHVVTLTVEDEVEAACTSSVVLTVGTPRVSRLMPSNGTVVNDGTPISFSTTVSDAQDQPNDVSLEWVANGNVISTQGATSTGEALLPRSVVFWNLQSCCNCDRHRWTHRFRPSELTINGLPSAPVVSISPSVPATLDGLNVSIDSPSVDPEGVTPTYIYAQGGQTQTAYTSSSLPSSATSR